MACAALNTYACATQHTVNIPLMEAHDLTAFLGDRDSGLHSMQSAALMEYTGGGEHFKARENIIVRRPASMRVEVMSALGVALVVAADAGQVAVFDPGKNTLMQGAATAAKLQRYARIPMTPDAAVRLMLALAPLLMLPSVQTSNNPFRLQLPWLGVAEPKMTLAGRVVVTMTPVASVGPALVIASV